MIEIEVFTENLQSVDVFTHCQQTYVGMAGAAAGISALEASAALSALDVAADARPRLFRDVLFMGREAAEASEEQRSKTNPTPSRSK